MIAIEKLRAMTNWFNYQNEGLTDGLTHVFQLELLYDYAKENELEFIDDEYLWSDNVTKEERQNALAHKDKVRSLNTKLA
jgi:hypothetical protein